MRVNYILIKGDKHFKCYSLLEIASHFNLSIDNCGNMICDGHQDTMSYSKEWNYEEAVTDFIQNRIEKVVPRVEIFKVQ